jgi:plasmid maintenance system antidote protein VapI
MYPNLRAEMARYGISANDLAKALSLSRKSINNKMIGRHKGFSLDEAAKIRNIFFPGISLDDLFAKKTQGVA